MEVDMTLIVVMASLESPIPDVAEKAAIKERITGQGWTFLCTLIP
jgi:hypothetical protein